MIWDLRGQAVGSFAVLSWLQGIQVSHCSLWKQRCCVLLWLAVEASKGPSSPFPGMLGSIVATPVLMLSVLCAVVLGASDRVAAIQSAVMLETWMDF